MQTYAILRRIGWRTTEDHLEFVELCSRLADEKMPDRVRWLRSYALAEEDGSIGSVCIYEATDAEALWEHGARTDVPIDEIFPVPATVVTTSDPEPVAG